MGYQLPGVETEGLPLHLIKALNDDGNIPFFVETGTAGGDSVRAASKIFSKCYTIEIIPGRYIDEQTENVVAYTGDSVSILPEIISKFNGEYVLFFLDGHYSDSVAKIDTGIKECPVLDEIKVIGKYENSVIIIDDARLFLGFAPFPLDAREWPGVYEIFIELRRAFSWHYITVTDDYILCVPDRFKAAIQAEWRDRFHIRYPSHEDKLKTEVKNVYTALKNYIDV